MAWNRDRRRVSKEHLALAVRKHFNATSASEPEVVSSFLYTVYNQGMSVLNRMPVGGQLSNQDTQTRVFECGLNLRKHGSS